MLLLNGKELDLLADEKDMSAYEKLIKECISELRKKYHGRFPLQVSFAKNQMRKEFVTYDFTNTFQRDAFPQQVMLNFTSEVLMFGDKVKIQYAEHNTFVGSDLVYLPRSKPFTGNLTIQEADIDLAFYLLYVFPDIESALEHRDIKKINVPSKGSFMFKFVDQAREFREGFDNKSVRAKVENLILNEVPDNIIKQMGMAYGVQRADIKATQTIRYDLVERLEYLDKYETESYVNVYVEFSERYKKLIKGDTETVLEAEIRSSIIEGLKYKVLNLNQGQKFNTWYLYSPETNRRHKKICDVPKGQTDEGALLLYLAEDNIMFDLLRNFICIAVEKETEKLSEEEDIDIEEIGKLEL